MGQTLTHGVYLPDEGERNCYSGLAANWQILDSSVGTIAAHTAALAGKAPLVHTHTKSDVTDLFNSANTWTGDNTYSKTVAIERSTDTGNFLALKNTVAELGSTPASATPVTIAFRDKDNDNLGYMGVYYDTDGSNHFRLYVRNKYTSGAPSTTGSYDYAFFGLRLNADKSKEGILRASFRPYDNNTHDLGSSSYQWNNLYAKKVNTQSVNGINPGALSLPDMGTTADVNYFDFISSITHLDGTDNFYTPTVDGWMTVIIVGTALSLFEDVSSSDNHVQGSGISVAPVRGYCLATIPVHKNKRVKIQAAGTSVYMAQVRPCMGNV